jgi:exosortase
LPTLALGALLWGSAAGGLWYTWWNDPAVSHGSLMVLLALGHLWARRREMGSWRAACAPGLALLALSCLTFVAASWADIVFLKTAALISATVGAVWFVGGRQALGASIGAFGFLAFMMPWPTTLTTRLAFPLQLTSSGYAAMLAGIVGVPIHREGVQLAVAWEPGMHIHPYEIIVAAKCSGLTSLIVLLALGYLIAYHTPVRFGWRALLVAAVVPLALVANAVRLTLVLLAGAHISKEVADQVHNHEAPVLIFFCSLGLMALRYGLLTWFGPRREEGTTGAPPPSPAHS